MAVAGKIGGSKPMKGKRKAPARRRVRRILRKVRQSKTNKSSKMHGAY